MARVELRNICKTLRGGAPGAEVNRAIAHEPRQAVRPGAAFRIEALDLEVPDGTVMAVLGPSGCGKSTLLRLIAGLMPLDAGEVLFDGVDVKGVPPGDRRIGFVFQNYALYPFRSRWNVLSYFKFRPHTPALEAAAAEKYRRTAALLGVELERLLDRMPRTLSGGEQQRVAVARCITRDPRLFLMDEPFSNLDQKLRERYRVQLRRLLKEYGITTVFVTHDQVEALILADRIALMNEGRIEQVGTAQEIYDAPRSLFAAEFLNFEPETPAINLVEGAALSPELGQYRAGFRPESGLIGARAAGAPPGSPRLEAEVLDCMDMPLRGLRILCVRAAGSELYVRLDRTEGFTRGERVPLAIARLHLFDPKDGRRIETRG